MAATTRSKRNLRSAISTPRKQPTSSRSSSSLSPSPSSSTSSSPSPSPSPPPPSSRTRTSRRTKPKASQNPYKRKATIVASAPTVLHADDHVVMRSPGGSNKLRPVSHEELESWSDSDHTTVYSSSASTSSSTTTTLREDNDFHDSQPLDLDDPWGYTFQPGEPVWVRTVGGNWYPGKISCQTTRVGRVKEDIDGLYYPAIFSTSSNSTISSSPLKSLKLRKYFAPMNGEIKPDTSYIRSLLSRHGWVSAT